MQCQTFGSLLKEGTLKALSHITDSYDIRQYAVIKALTGHKDSSWPRFIKCLNVRFCVFALGLSHFDALRKQSIPLARTLTAFW